MDVATEAFLYIKHVTTLLQTKAKARQQDNEAAACKPLIKALMYLNHAVQKALAAYATGALSKEEFSQQLLHAACRSLAAAGTQCCEEDLPCTAAAQQVTKDRARQLEEELVFMQSLSAHGQIHPAGDVSKLAKAMTMLRNYEVDVALHARMALEVQQHVDNSDYSDVNFAYGSTPYSSWLQVLQHPLVTVAVAAAMSAQPAISAQAGRQCMVWGSSIGWLVFYAALTFNWPCVGYELLTCLHECASKLQQQLCLQDAVVLVNADMLTSDLSNVGLLLLANQCWDEDLMKQVSRKLMDELPTGCVVVEYRDSLASQSATQRRSASQQSAGSPTCTVREGTDCPAALKLVAHVEVPVSWNEHQRMHVYQKVVKVEGTG